MDKLNYDAMLWRKRGVVSEDRKLEKNNQ